MTAPVTPAVPGLPVVPPRTPAWLVRLVAFLVAAVGPAVAWVDPTGKISTPTAQAIVILGFLVVAAAIFVVHLAIEAVRDYGWSKSAAVAFAAGTASEIEALLPEARTVVATAKPYLDQLPAVGTLVSDVAGLKAKAAAVPATDRAAIEAAIKDLVVPLAIKTPTAPASPGVDPVDATP